MSRLFVAPAHRRPCITHAISISWLQHADLHLFDQTKQHAMSWLHFVEENPRASFNETFHRPQYDHTFSCAFNCWIATYLRQQVDDTSRIDPCVQINQFCLEMRSFVRRKGGNNRVFHCSSVISVNDQKWDACPLGKRSFWRTKFGFSDGVHQKIEVMVKRLNCNFYAILPLNSCKNTFANFKSPSLPFPFVAYFKMSQFRHAISNYMLQRCL